jgi:hypothetical protein
VPERDRGPLLELVRRARRKAWWHAYNDIMPPESAKFYGLEDGAATIQIYGSVLIPGLLQTREYTAALMSAARGVEPGIVKRRLELRMHRQELLVREHPPTVDVVLHEPVLNNTMNGKEVTAAQLGRLVELARKPHVTIRVLPMSAGPHEAAGVPFTIFGFAGPEDPSVVYHEQPTRNNLIEAPGEVAWYTDAFAQATSLALSQRRSIEAIRRAARSLT